MMQFAHFSWEAAIPEIASMIQKEGILTHNDIETSSEKIFQLYHEILKFCFGFTVL